MTAAVFAPSSTLGASGPREAPEPRVMAEAAALRKTWEQEGGGCRCGERVKDKLMIGGYEWRERVRVQVWGGKVDEYRAELISWK
jgi:hypothetical protein